LGSDPLMLVRIVQVLISIGSIYLVYLIARQSGSTAAAFLAVILAAVYPPSFMASGRILTEVIYVFLLLGYIYSLIMAFSRHSPGWHGLSGAFLAMTVLVRPAILPFLPVPYIITAIQRRNIRYFRGFWTAAVIFCIVMTPWWVRNYLVFDKLIITATQSGDPFLRGTDPYDVYDKFGPSIIQDVPQEQKTRVALDRIRQGFKTDPWLWVKWFTVGKFSFLWLKPWGVYNWFSKYLHLWVYVIPGWAGVGYSLFNEKMRWPAIIVLFFAGLHLAFIPIQRYMYPLMPVMAVMAAALIVKIVEKALDTACRNR